MADGQPSSSSRRVTLLDVARDAGVSRATASLVLRDSPLVAASTRERVQASMQKLGYVYNRAAASLRAQHSQTIGLAITDITNPFFAELAVSIEAQLDEARYVALLSNTADRLDRQDRLLETMHGYQVDGLLLCPAQDTPQRTIDQLRAWKLPCVLVARYLADSLLDYVGADNLLGARVAVEHLHAHGHRRIAFLGGPATSSARQDRLAGYRETHTALGLSVDDALLLTSPVSRAGGFAAMQSLLAQPNRPTAAVCYNDVVAFGAMLGLQSENLLPGRDFAIVGFDDIADAALIRPALTTVSISPQRIGIEAVRLLFDRIAIPTAPPQRIILPPHLIVRESCGG